MGGEKTALGFGLDWIRTLVTMATDSSHRVIMGENVVTTLVPSFLIGSSLFLQVMRTTMRSRIGLKFGEIRLGTAELAAIERLEKSPQTYIERNVVTTLASLFLNGSSFLQVMMTTFKAWMSSNFGQIPSLNTELAALERLKNKCIML